MALYIREQFGGVESERNVGSGDQKHGGHGGVNILYDDGIFESKMTESRVSEL